MDSRFWAEFRLREADRFTDSEHIALRERLKADKRDPTQSRLKAGLAELRKLARGTYDNLIDFRIANPDGAVDAVAQKVYEKYLQAIG